MGEEQKKKKLLLQDDSDLKKIIEAAEQSVDVSRSEAPGAKDVSKPSEKAPPAGRVAQLVIDDPEFLSSLEESTPPQKKSNSYVMLGITLLSALLATVLYINASTFNDSLNTIYKPRSIPEASRPSGGFNVKTVTGKGTERGPGFPGIGNNHAENNLAVPQKPVIKKFIYDDNPPVTASPSTSPPATLTKSGVKIPESYRVVKEEANGAKVYVNSDAEIYVLNPEKGTLDKIVRRHAP